MDQLTNQILEMVKDYCEKTGTDEIEALIIAGHALEIEAQFMAEDQNEKGVK